MFIQCAILPLKLIDWSHICVYIWLYQVSDKRPLSSLNDESQKQTGQPVCVNRVTRTDKQVLKLSRWFSDQAVDWSTRCAVTGKSGDSKRKP